MDKEAYLADLISRMAVQDRVHTSEESVSWQAYREAEAADDPEFPGLVKKFVEAHGEKKDRRLRSEAYYLLSRLLGKTADGPMTEYLVGRVDAESDRYVLMGLLEGIGGLDLPDDVDILPVIRCTESTFWQIRYPAVLALRSSARADAREPARSFVLREDVRRWNREMTYACVVLGERGEPEDIPAIEPLTKVRFRDLREVAKEAVARIRRRFPERRP